MGLTLAISGLCPIACVWEWAMMMRKRERVRMYVLQWISAIRGRHCTRQFRTSLEGAVSKIEKSFQVAFARFA